MSSLERVTLDMPTLATPTSNHHYNKRPHEGSGASKDLATFTAADQESMEMLAASVRLAAHFGWTEGVRNHFSVEISNRRIAVQCENVPWNLMTMKDLVVFDLDSADNAEPPHGASISAFGIHRDLHRALGSRGRCIMHLHSPFATALSCTVPGKLEMVHQNAAYFYGVVGYFEYPQTGTETTSEVTADLMRAFGEKNRVLLQANHGVLVIGESVYSAFDDLFYFENACTIHLRALSTGLPLKVLHPEVCKRVMAMRERDREEYGKRHLQSLVAGYDMKSKL